MGADGQGRRTARGCGPRVGSRLGLTLELLGAGREAEVFAWEEGRVLRLARDADGVDDVEREALALTVAHRAGVPVPAPYDQVTVRGRPGLVMGRVDGEDLLTELGRRPWSVWSIAKTLGRQHAELHAVEAPNALAPLRERLRRRLSSELVPDDIRGDALARLARLPDGDRLCHGDFHPGNLLRTENGYAVIDWTTSARGHPSADVARTLLLLGMGEVPPEAPAAVRWLARVGRPVLRLGYLRAYGRRLLLDKELVAGWKPICVAVRLAEGIEAERAALLALARAA
ncbi:MAG TPA: aminoglycoside phosphotransferase family protein [Gaiellaceae bacterium]|nr:aminoglycoside phosphotransferase family protein [Gaiellaceae bacterium]